MTKKKLFSKKKFFFIFDLVIINVRPKSLKKTIFFRSLIYNFFRNKLTKCPTKVVCFVGHFVSLLRKKFYVNNQKKMRLFLDFGRTFCFLKSDLRKKSVNVKVRNAPPLRF